MQPTVSVTEANYDFWKSGTIISALASTVIFIVFLMLEDPFWISITRLGAFVFFALTVLCYLQIMNGPISVLLDTTDSEVIISYQKKGEIIQEEEFAKETVKEVFATSAGVNVMLQNLKPSIKTFKIRFTDTDRELNLFEFSGRPLLFEKSSQEKVEQFFKTLLT
ncbi:hypothetical protein [Fodinibius sp. Rm-B-1B1-1]|uniref:hypothetical protein n=1 Tax=Fodinibius alkaliphilus TaxID=3140241 RepID=UPI00315A15B7